MRPIRSIKLLAPTLLTAALTGCGGGGDDAATSAAAGIPTSAAGATGDLTAANHATVALQVREVLLLSADTAGLFAPIGSDGGVAASVPKIQTATRAVLRTTLSGTAGRKGILSATGTATRQAVSTVTEACSGGGSVTVVVNDADNDNEVSTGDSMTITASQCIENGERINGQASVAVNALTDARAAVTVQFQGLSVTGATLSGTVSVDLTYSGWDVNGTLKVTSLVLTEAGQPTIKATYTQTLTYVDTSGITSTSTQGGVVIGNDGYWIQQIAPYQTYRYAAYPFTGRLSVTDKDGDRVIGVALPTAMRYEYFKAGNTSPTPDAITEIPNT